MEGSVWQLSDGELLATLDAVEVEQRRCYARMLALVHEVDQRGVAGRAGNVTVQRLLQLRLHCSPGEAAARVRAARGLLAGQAPSGAVTEPVLPATAAALADARVGSEQVRIIDSTLRQLPHHIDSGTRARAERYLAGHAADLDAGALRTITKTLRATLDPDGRPPPEDEHPDRELHLRADDRGGTIGSFRLDLEGAAVLKAALDPLSAPRPETPEGKDRRSLATRRGDALVELAERALDDGELPRQGGERPHLGVVIDFDKLIAQLGSVTLDTGDQLSVEALRRIACDAQIFPAVLRGQSEPMDIGRAARTVPPSIRRLLTIRDKGCAFPGCTRPARWCHAHHIHHWSAGGPTELGNLVLLCGHHHRVMHHTDWDVDIVNGRATFYPPPWADPERSPLVNSLHHLDDHLPDTS